MLGAPGVMATPTTVPASEAMPMGGRRLQQVGLCEGGLFPLLLGWAGGYKRCRADRTAWSPCAPWTMAELTCTAAAAVLGGLTAGSSSQVAAASC